MYNDFVNLSVRFEHACKKYLSNISIVAGQNSLGVVVKPNTQGYNVLFLDYTQFAIDTNIENDYSSIILDYTLTN
jgi:hypothetical protein